MEILDYEMYAHESDQLRKERREGAGQSDPLPTEWWCFRHEQEATGIERRWFSSLGRSDGPIWSMVTLLPCGCTLKERDTRRPE